MNFINIFKKINTFIESFNNNEKIKTGKLTKEILIKINIIPKRILYRNNRYIIIGGQEKYIINNYVVILDNDNKLIDLRLFTMHPNADENNHFCLSEEIKYKKWNDSLQNIINELLSVYNLNDCYFNPMCEFKTKKI